jgi:hypothetical protein
MKECAKIIRSEIELSDVDILDLATMLAAMMRYVDNIDVVSREIKLRTRSSSGRRRRRGRL